MSSRQLCLKKAVEFLVGMKPGTKWTEYHWRLALDLKQEIKVLKDEYALDEKIIEEIMLSLDGLPYTEKVKGQPYSKYLDATERIKRLRQELADEKEANTNLVKQVKEQVQWIKWADKRLTKLGKKKA